MRYYAVIDTNVIVSAMLKWDSVPGQVVRFVFEGKIVPLLHSAVVEEYHKVLLRPKFHLTDQIVDDFLLDLEEHGIYMDAEPLDLALPDPKDRIFYEIVITARRNEDVWLVTGNLRHFPIQPFVVSPRQMLEVIERDL